MTNRLSIYDKVTASIVKAIETDPGRHKMPWHRGQNSMLPENAVSGVPYRGINIVALWAAADERSFQTGRWATYRQWQSIGAQVRKGETSSDIVFFKEYEVAPNPDDPEDDGKRAAARGYSVFNADQVDGAPAATTGPDHGPITRSAAFDAMVQATGAIIHIAGQRAFYRPSADTITMPEERLFTGTDTMSRDESVMAVLAHELGHWTLPKHRLDRDWSKRGYKPNEALAMEELTAELCAANLCALHGFSTEPRVDHAQYIASWITLLKTDNRAIFKAAAAAARAADYIMGVSKPVGRPDEANGPPPSDAGDSFRASLPTRPAKAGFLLPST